MPFDLVEALIRTQGLRVAPPGELFWYTSGTVGPYYLNTHYLYGNRQKAEQLLAFIDQNRGNINVLASGLLARTGSNYLEDACYRLVIDSIAELVRRRIDGDSFQIVSGGERRDWFFSIAVARRLDKRILLLFKDRRAFVLEENAAGANPAREVSDLKGAAVLHVADLVTEASSYVRSWIPAIEQLGGRLQWAVNIVDRGQGAEEVLARQGVKAFHLIGIDSSFFEMLRKEGQIGDQEAELLEAYHRNPSESMKRLLQTEPDIVRRALSSSNAKVRNRAQMLIERNPYGFDAEFLQALTQP